MAECSERVVTPGYKPVCIARMADYLCFTPLCLNPEGGTDESCKIAIFFHHQEKMWDKNRAKNTEHNDRI
jgi:hypothetical protein